METLNEMILCLGSNREREANLGRAAEWLRASFVSVRFAPAVYTEPVGLTCGGRFLNQVALAYSDRSLEESRGLLKAIEAEMGRAPLDKAAGSVPIDIDLLRWNGHVLKADDWARDYVVRGVRYLEGEGVSPSSRIGFR